jgi:hypothetical protein
VSTTFPIYTEALLQHIHTPGVEIVDMFKRVGAAVVAKSQGEQVPWINTSLYNDVYLTPSSFALQGDLQVHVNVDAAQVRINGLAVGIARRDAPLVVRHLEAGTLTVRVEADGYDPLERPVNIAVHKSTPEAFIFYRRSTLQETFTPPPMPATGSQPVSPSMSQPQPAPPARSEVEIIFWGVDAKTGQPVPRARPPETSGGGRIKK